LDIQVSFDSSIVRALRVSSVIGGQERERRGRWYIWPHKFEELLQEASMVFSSKFLSYSQRDPHSGPTDQRTQ
jgi:hypothetical protein